MSSMWNYTEWYPGNIKPVRDGIYEVRSDVFDPAYAWFNVSAVEWGAPRESVESAKTAVKAIIQDRAWRGLTEEYKSDDGGQRPAHGNEIVNLLSWGG
jgi:hypothetical protein